MVSLRNHGLSSEGLVWGLRAQSPAAKINLSILGTKVICDFSTLKGSKWSINVVSVLTRERNLFPVSSQLYGKPLAPITYLEVFMFSFLFFLLCYLINLNRLPFFCYLINLLKNNLGYSACAGNRSQGQHKSAEVIF